MSVALAMGVLLLMGIALLLVPLGLPGVWIMAALLAIPALLGEVALWVPAIALAIAGLGELGEFLFVRALSQRYGGSRRAFWGAIVGGLAGLAVGTPVPVVGPLLVGVAGTFAGAALVSYWETRAPRGAARVGWGALVGRAGAAALKVAAGIAVLALAAARLLFG